MLAATLSFGHVAANYSLRCLVKKLRISTRVREAIVLVGSAYPKS
jgi:hypothetical protein